MIHNTKSTNFTWTYHFS